MPRPGRISALRMIGLLTTILERTVNGQPGLVAQQDGVTVSVFALDIAGDRIKHIWVIRNPEKLGTWTEPSVDMLTDRDGRGQ